MIAFNVRKKLCRVQVSGKGVVFNSSQTTVYVRSRDRYSLRDPLKLCLISRKTGVLLELIQRTRLTN